MKSAVTRIFGNPGAMEQGFLDALGDFPSLHYILTLQESVAMLAEADRPTLYVGDGVAWSGAQPELKRLCEMLGANVWGSDAGKLNLPYDHPLWCGQTGHMFGPQSLPVAQSGDVNLIVGAYIFPEVFPVLGDIWAEGARSIHVDLNAYEITKKHPVDLGLVADPKLTLAAIADVLEGKRSESKKATARAKLEQAGAAKSAQHEQELATDRARGDATPLHFSRLMMELAPRLPADTVIFDEGLTSSPELTRWAQPTKVGQFFQTRGGSLGVGLASSIGVQVANHGKTVLAVSGDGGAMYTIQALWSAARHNLSVSGDPRGFRAAPYVPYPERQRADPSIRHRHAHPGSGARRSAR